MRRQARFNARKIRAEPLADGDTYDAVMKKIPTRTGDCYFVPPQRLHGLDGGNLAFEVQQNSDAGFGWDWAGFVEAGVVTPEDAARHKQLAVEYALYEDGTQEQTRQVTLEDGGNERTFCCACRYFVLENLKIRDKTQFNDPQNRFNTFTLINGAATFSGGGETVFAKRGESLIIPANVEIEIAPNSLTNAGEVEILRCYVPNLQRDVVDFLRALQRVGQRDRVVGFVWRGQRPVAAPGFAARFVQYRHGRAPRSRART